MAISGRVIQRPRAALSNRREHHSLVDLLLKWQERASMRRRLEGLDDHMLRDIGLSRGQLLHEVRKPFWRA